MLNVLPSPQSIVLENLTFPFLRPNILDVKLGTVLYAEGAPADKVARMEKTARETTSASTGIRLTGFQVRDLPATQRAWNSSLNTRIGVRQYHGEAREHAQGVREEHQAR